MLLRTILSIPIIATLQAANFTVPITVTKLPPNSEFVIVHAPIDFDLLTAHDATAPVDERSLRLFAVQAGMPRVEIPYQFIASPQPRPRSRPLAPETSPNVSYAAEYAATNAPNLKV